MNTNRIRFSLFALLILVIGLVQSAAAQTRSATLYSPNRYRNEQRDFCLDFKMGASPQRLAGCDLKYGSLYAGNDLDWFESATARGSRSVIKDLGPLSWESEIRVLVVKPQPKLLPGEQRTITVDVSGADGADGAPGRSGLPGADADGVIRAHQDVLPPKPATPAKKKHDGKPKIDPVFVKAIVGHMYVVRVVDESKDYYVLFRVDAIERGDHCKISWKLIDAPKEDSPVN